MIFVHWLLARSSEAENFASCAQDGAAAERLGQKADVRVRLGGLRCGMFAVAGHIDHTECGVLFLYARG
jgi:hypothetical protein